MNKKIYVKNMLERGGLSNRELEMLEEQIGYELPQDYRQFLLEVGGAGISEYEGFEVYPDAYFLKRKPEEIDPEWSHLVYIEEANDYAWVYRLFGFKGDEPDGGPDSIINAINLYGEYLEEMGEPAIWIGSSMRNGLFFISLYEDDYGFIYYWDKARVFDCSSDESNVFFVAESFTDFLKMINKEADDK